MAYAEKRGNLWRARWRAPDGTLESKTGFTTRKDAENYGHDQEAAIRSNTYVDPRVGQITLTEWVNQWFPSLDLELATLSYYRYMIEAHILPEFGDHPLTSLTAEAVSLWEKRIVERGYAKRTAQGARIVLTTVLGDAIPRHIQVNVAQRRSAKGRRGVGRIERHLKAEKVWPTPLQALLVAERCAALSGQDTDFVMIVHLAYTGSRWSEVMGLPPDCVREDQVDIAWKLYELDGRFYKGRPKDGSIRPVDLPPFLAELLGHHLKRGAARTCTCKNTEAPWCPGDKYVFLGLEGGHPRRSNYAERFFRPAADGWYLPRGGKSPRPAMPVLVADPERVPGRPVPAWPTAVPGEAYQPPTGRGRARLLNDERRGRCQICGRGLLRRADGRLVSHASASGPDRCPGSGQPSAPDVTVASWLPILRGLTPHGLRHGLQTWMDEDGIPDVLKTERMGHEMPGMHGVYGHVSPTMRANLKAALQARWETSLRERARLSPHSAVSTLDALLEPYRETVPKIESRATP
jgi:integrase